MKKFFILMFMMVSGTFNAFALDSVKAVNAKNNILISNLDVSPKGRVAKVPVPSYVWNGPAGAACNDGGKQSWSSARGGYWTCCMPSTSCYNRPVEH